MYTVIIGEPGTNKMKTLKNVQSLGINEQLRQTVIF